MNTRTILAVVLSFLVFFLFTYLGERYGSKPPAESPAPKVAKPAKPSPAPAPKPAATTEPAPAPVPAGTPSRPAREVVVETDLFRAVFSERGAALTGFQLKNYRQKLPFETISKFSLGPVSFEIERFRDPNNSAAAPKELVTIKAGQRLPLSLAWQSHTHSVSPNLVYQASAPALTVRGQDTAVLTFKGVTPEGLEITKTYSFRGQSYAFELKTTVANRTAETLKGELNLALTGAATAGPEAQGLVVFAAHSLEGFKPGKLKEPKVFTDKVQWIALDELFFLAAAVPQGAPQVKAILQEPAADELKATLNMSETLAARQEIQVSYALYFGPKNISDLRAANLGLDRVVNFGWFDFLARPFLYFLKWMNGFVHNYGWSLIMLTILLRLVFWYPNHKSFQSMKVMQKIQPRVAEIREKYKDDREAMNRELMNLYRTFKVNPLGGCLPMLLQLPVFLALYNLLSYSIELRHAPFISTLPFTDIVWLADLSARDPLLITPIVMGVSMFVQQKMSPSPGDPAQAKMMMFLPLIFTFLFLNFASGLVIYWLVNNILAIIQQYFTNKYLK
ncbi:MAG: membrane protein insertase YidC [Desulfobaccales bacterium]